MTLRVSSSTLDTCTYLYLLKINCSRAIPVAQPNQCPDLIFGFLYIE